jgi:hypothetical protein
MPSIQYIRFTNWFDELDDDDYIFDNTEYDDYWISVGNAIALSLLE